MKELPRESDRPDHAPDAERDDVHVATSPGRCPFCHEGKPHPSSACAT